MNMDYILNVYKDGEFLFAVGGNYMDYDNVIWWQLEELVKVVRSNNSSKEKLLEDIQDKAFYFKYVLNEVEEHSPSIDIKKEFIDMHWMPIYEFEDVCQDECCIDLVKIDDKYFAKYCDDNLYPMPNVEFDEKLLRKTRVSFDEFLKISNFMNSIQDLENDTDFILNNSKVLRLNSI